jgi:predicted AlkP superfamily phosphohydrolase/phosphomutase
MMIQTRLIVLDGVCWPGFAAACRQGRVPTLARLAAAGATGLLHGVAHQGRIGAAASIASGHWPEASGLWFREEAWAGGVRPATMASWQVPPVWPEIRALAGVQMVPKRGCHLPVLQG